VGVVSYQQDLGQAQLTIAQQFAVVGGSGAVTENGAPKGSAVLYVRKIQTPAASITGAGLATDTQWRGYGALSTQARTTQANGLRAGRTWTLGGYTFYVKAAPDTTRGIAVYELDPA
jgi:hypothetical protein